MTDSQDQIYLTCLIKHCENEIIVRYFALHNNFSIIDTKYIGDENHLNPVDSASSIPQLIIVSSF